MAQFASGGNASRGRPGRTKTGSQAGVASGDSPCPSRSGSRHDTLTWSHRCQRGPRSRVCSGRVIASLPERGRGCTDMHTTNLRDALAGRFVVGESSPFFASAGEDALTCALQTRGTPSPAGSYRPPPLGATHPRRVSGRVIASLRGCGRRCIDMHTTNPRHVRACRFVVGE